MTKTRNRPSRGGLLTSVALFAFSGAIAAQQIDPASIRPQVANIPLEAAMNPPSDSTWRVSAWLTEDFDMTVGYVRLTSASLMPITSARFYGEYYDDAGRLCFTLAFDQDKNLDGARGPFRPGQTRTLIAQAQLAPAARPRRLRLWSFTETSDIRSPSQEVLAPVTIRDGTTGPVSDIIPHHPNEPLTPLALIEANIDVRGTAVSINVIAAEDQAASAWARDLVSKLRFAPATRGGSPVAATTLVLIRAVQYVSETIPSGLVFEEPWVKAYIAASRTNENRDLPIANLLRVQREPGSDAMRYYSIGTDWCLDVFHWISDRVHGGFRREWVPSTMRDR